MADHDFASGSAQGESAERWYIARQGQPHGPVAWNDLLALLRAGEVSEADFVWREGLENWVPLGSLAGTASATPSQMPPCPPAAPPLGAAPRPRPAATRPPATTDKRRGQTGQGRLLAAIIVAAILVAGAVGWSLHGLSGSARQQTHVDESLRDSSRLGETRPRAETRPLAETPPRAETTTQPPTAAKIKESSAPPAVPEKRLPSAPEATVPPSTTDVKPPEGAKPATTDLPPTTDKPPPAKVPTEDPKPAARRTLYQEVVISRRPSFNVSGVSISQDLRYRVVSKLLVGTRAADGTFEVNQVIDDTRLEKSDELSRAAFEESLRALRGQEFRYTLDKQNEIVKFAGPRDTRKSVKAGGAGGDRLLITSVMDDDGWRELAQLTFFRPPGPLQRGDRFERKHTHDWGELGSWYGRTVYTPAAPPPRGGEQRIDYAHYLHYDKPQKKASDLPFEITSAQFKIEQASGSIQWDAKLARMTSATERFVVRGAVTTALLGQSVEAQVEETQDFTLRVTDDAPVPPKSSERPKR